MSEEVLSSEQITELEAVIKKNNPVYLSMSYNSMHKGKKCYETILDKSTATYMIFSCEGYNTYALYKSVSSKIYIISNYMQTPEEYCPADNLFYF